MSIAVNLKTVASSIAGLTFSGINTRDIDEIPDSALMLTPLLIPRPNEFVTDIKPEAKSFGFNGTQKLDLGYTLNYVYLHAEIGSGIGAFEIYNGLMTNLVTILEKILNNDVVTGAVDMQLEKIGGIGTIDDPAGNQYWGVMFSFRVLEHGQ